jgi:hypothetical protein
MNGQGKLLKESAVIFSAQNIGSIRVIRENGNDIERPRQMVRDRKPHIDSRGRGSGGNNTQSETVSPSIVTESALKSLAVTAYELVVSVYDHLRRVGPFGREPRGVPALPMDLSSRDCSSRRFSPPAVRTNRESKVTGNRVFPFKAYAQSPAVAVQ